MITAKEYINKVYRHKTTFDRVDMETALASFFNVNRAIILIQGNERKRVKESVKYRTIKEIMDYQLIDSNSITPEMKDDLEYRMIEKF